MRRLQLAVLAGLACAAAAITGSDPALAASACSATDTSNGFTSSDLQAVVDQASSGDTVTVAGTCPGVSVGTVSQSPGFVITLQGVGKSPTLSGGQAVLDMPIGPNTVTVESLTLTGGFVGVRNSVNDTVLLQDCTITNNNLGVIENSNGVTMTLDDTRVSGSVQGGILNEGAGTLLLEGASTVTHNKTPSYGGGIYNDSGSTLLLQDTASVTHNTAGLDGGGIYNLGTLSVAPTATVAKNRPNNIAP